jgi:hypothetical protein
LALTGFPFTIREIFAIYGLSSSTPTLPGGAVISDVSGL